jgi:hypothetical protein
MRPIRAVSLRNIALLGFSAIALILLQHCSNKGGSTPSGITYPAALNIPGVGTHGIFDASLAQDPASSRVWMSYSAINPSVMWPTQNFDTVSTRLAYSDDQGATWTDSGSTVNDVLDVTLALPAPLNAGTWHNEVSSLVYDPGASVNERWKLLWHHYLLINGDRRFEHGWISLKTASTPTQLASATEIKLFSGVGYDLGNNTAGGASGSPVGGPPAIALDTAISTDLNGCFFTEPGMLATSSALYVSMLCVKSPTDHRIILLKCDSPCDLSSAPSWTYLGTALNDADAASFGFDQGFSAPNLVTSNGQNYLIVTPQSTTPFDSYYNGCRVFRFTDIDTASIQRTGGVPDIVATVNGDAGSFDGACTYLPTASKAGVIYSQAFFGPTEKFRLFMSGTNF